MIPGLPSFCYSSASLYQCQYTLKHNKPVRPGNEWVYISTIHIGTNIRHHYWIYSTAVCLCACIHTQHKWAYISTIHIGTNIRHYYWYTVQPCVCLHVYTHNISEPIFSPYILVPILDITTGYTVQLCVCVHVYTHNISEPIFPPYILVPILDTITGYTVQLCVCVHAYTHNISEPIFPPYILVPILDTTTGYTVQLCVCVHLYTHNISTWANNTNGCMHHVFVDTSWHKNILYGLAGNHKVLEEVEEQLNTHYLHCQEYK